MRRAAGLALVAVGTAVAVLALGSVARVGRGAEDRQTAAASPVAARRADPAALRERLRQVPGDDAAWAALGMAYVEQAKVSANPQLYPKAEGALRRSLKLRPEDNYVAAAGMAALANARHDFAGARRWARTGLAVNPANASLYGTLVDAETQLGHYQEAWDATQRMVDLSPDAASLARVSYSWELRGNLDEARSLMQRALDQALGPAQQAFARYQLGDLALVAGDAHAALAQYEAGLAADPSYAALLEGRARAELALGRSDDAVRDLGEAVARLPQPGYVLLYGELLESLGRRRDASRQYELFRTEQRLFEANGVAVDVEAALFEADHGDAGRAVAVADRGLRSRPFVEMQDACAWALHKAGRDAEALEASARARSLGTRNALFEFHAGMIELALGHPDQARAHLASALAANPAFHPLHATTARRALASLEGR
ncbi:MAG TPA: tetratricopeptide repeat protein [Acidimicrobiales bacterium]|nr:tetratricopeptide repeat protein [Acidimicrobiales bacterium]